MKTKILSLFTALAMTVSLFTSIPTVSAADITKDFTPSKDAGAQTWQTEKYRNYGSKDTLKFENMSVDNMKQINTPIAWLSNRRNGTDWKVAFIGFDLSELNGKTINNATLTIKVKANATNLYAFASTENSYRYNYNGTDTSAATMDDTEAVWTEGTSDGQEVYSATSTSEDKGLAFVRKPLIEYKNGDTYTSDLSGITNLASAAIANVAFNGTNDITLNITDYINDKIKGTASSVTVALIADGKAEIYSKESSGNAPKLTITRSAGDSEPIVSVSMGNYTCGQDTVNPVSASSTNDTENVKYQYKAKDADDSTYTSTKPITAGEYTVKATFPAKDDYPEATATADFTVSHNFTGDYEHDETNHWQKCSCQTESTHTAHNWGNWTFVDGKEPTVEEGSSATHTCSTCNYTSESETVPALSDTSVWQLGTRVEPGNGTTGSQEYTSKYGTVTVTLPAIDHNHTMGNWVVNTLPTLISGGKATRQCTHTSNEEQCTYTETTDVPMLSDMTVWTAGEVTQNPTTETVGKQKYISETFGEITIDLPQLGANGAYSFTPVKDASAKTYQAEKYRTYGAENTLVLSNIADKYANQINSALSWLAIESNKSDWKIAYIGFDLSQLKGKDIKNASLTLKVNSAEATKLYVLASGEKSYRYVYDGTNADAATMEATNTVWTEGGNNSAYRATDTETDNGLSFVRKPQIEYKKDGSYTNDLTGVTSLNEIAVTSAEFSGTNDITLDLTGYIKDKLANDETAQTVTIALIANGKAEIHSKESEGNAPALTVSVYQQGTASVTMADFKHGETVPSPHVISTTNGTENVTYQYKAKNAEDSTYADEMPTVAGEYTVKATFPATDVYGEVTATADFTISHNYSIEWSKDENNHYHSCPCGDKKDEAAHNYGDPVVTEADCTTPGSKVSTCSECGYVKNEAISVNDNHDWNSWTLVSNPTLTETGVAKRTCKRNSNHVETKDDVPNLSDTNVWTAGEKHEPTEEGDGSQVFTSTEYGTVTVTYPALNHEHEWGNWEIVTAPTLTETGVAKRTCAKNSSHTETKNDVPNLSNTSVWTPGDVTKQPTEEETGTQEYTSTEYGTVELILPKSEHTHVWGDWTLTKEPTLTETGTATRTCTKDKSHIDTKNDVPNLSNTSVWTSEIIEQPTVDKEGKRKYTSEYGEITVTVPKLPDLTVPQTFEAIGKYADKVEVQMVLDNGKLKFTLSGDDVPAVKLYVAEYDENNQTLVSLKTGKYSSGNIPAIIADIPSGNNYKIMIWDADYCPVIHAITAITE